MPEKLKNISTKTKKCLAIVAIAVLGILIALCMHKSDRKMAMQKVLFKDKPYETKVLVIISEESNNDYEVIFRYMEEKR